jgi:hypothetical protein
MGQNYITSSILEYLYDKFIKIYGYAKAQKELAESLKHSLMFYTLSGELYSAYLFEILKFILPNLNELDYLYFKKIFSTDKNIFNAYFPGRFLPRDENLDKNSDEDYFFNKIEFKILDILYNYDILDYDDSLNMIKYLINSIYSAAFFQSEYIYTFKSLSLFLFYLAENQLLNAKVILQWDAIHQSKPIQHDQCLGGPEEERRHHKAKAAH